MHEAKFHVSFRVILGNKPKRSLGAVNVMYRQALGKTTNHTYVAELNETRCSLCSVVYIKIVSPAVETTGGTP